MQVLALDRDTIVFVSRVWQTTCTALRSGEEGFVIDSPVYPDELDALARVLDQAGFPVCGLLATHGDWDHLLGRLAFAEASLGCAQTTAQRLGREPGEAQRELRSFDAEHYVERERPLALAGVQALPVPGRLALGPDGQRGLELELHPADGHTDDGMAILAPGRGLLIAGDYLSPVEIPMLSPTGSLDAYAATLERLRELLGRAEIVIPGHGGPVPSARAHEILDEDVRYLEDLARHGQAASLPPSRRTAQQRLIHAGNAARVAGLEGSAG